MWRGSALRCPSSGNRIVLYHSQFYLHSMEECNLGNVVARSLGIENGTYISRLNVTIDEDMNMKTIQCVGGNVITQDVIGTHLISVITG